MTDQTAEMRGLAFISGCKDLMHLLLEPDENFGIPKPECLPDGIDAEDCIVRLKFPDYITKPADKDKFLMTYAADGVIKATFTEDQLQRNPDGSLKHPKQDLHWQVCELSRAEVREVMNKKKDRGAAKVVNFCLCSWTPVLTQDGYKRIKDVTTDDKLFDGKRWVSHKGVVPRGFKVMIERWGITCTPDHLIYVRTPEGTIRQVCAMDAYRRGNKPLTIQVDMNIYNKPCPHKFRGKVEPLSDRVRKRQALLRRCVSIIEDVPFQNYTKHERKLVDAFNVMMERERIRNGCSYGDTYDIVDVGDTNRFVAAGMLVHNSSSYGGTATSISRKIEADTGVKATPEEAQALLDAVEHRQPRATEFFKEMEQVPEKVGFIRAASGRIRHCHTMERGIDGMARTREGQITALGRECRNFL